MRIEIDADKIIQHFKSGRHSLYEEEKHCNMLIRIMGDKTKGTISAFCVEAMITDDTFYNWVKKHELFRYLYVFSKILARELWESEGMKLRDEDFPMGTVNYKFEHWKMIGWSRFGVSKNSRIKLNLDPNGTPLDHYKQVLIQASEGDFTAAEIKQLMEAVNVGLNTHQVFELQKQIDDLKSDLSIVTANTNVQNPFTNKGTAQKD